MLSNIQLKKNKSSAMLYQVSETVSEKLQPQDNCCSNLIYFKIKILPTNWATHGIFFLAVCCARKTSQKSCICPEPRESTCLTSGQQWIQALQPSGALSQSSAVTIRRAELQLVARDNMEVALRCLKVCTHMPMPSPLLSR